MPLTAQDHVDWAHEARKLYLAQNLSLTVKQASERLVHIIDDYLLKYTRKAHVSIEDWTAAMVRSGLLAYVPESAFKEVAPRMGLTIANDTVCSFLGKAAVLTKDGVALAMIFRDMDRNPSTTDHERDLRRYSAEQAKELAAFFGRPVHDLTLDEIEKFKILDESTIVSETADGFAVEIANVELEQYHDSPGTLMDIGGITFTRHPDLTADKTSP